MADKVVDIRREMPAAQRTQIAPNGVIGMSLFVMAEMMMFAGLISAHAIGKSVVPGGWPPPNQPRLPVEETAINTAALILSAIVLAFAQKTFKRDPAAATKPLLIAVCLGAFFVAFQGMEWAGLLGQGLSLTTNTYMAFFYLIIGMHGMHAIAAVAALGWVYTKSRKGELRQSVFATVQVFWYFVVGLWPILYWRVYF